MSDVERQEGEVVAVSWVLGPAAVGFIFYSLRSRFTLLSLAHLPSLLVESCVG